MSLSKRVKLVVGAATLWAGGANHAGPHVLEYKGSLTAGQELLRSYYAFDEAFKGGARVATCDLNRDRVPDTVVGAGPGAGPHLKVFDGKTGAELLSFFAFSQEFRGGVYVACARRAGQAQGMIIVGAGTLGTGPDAGAGPHVKAFDFPTKTEVHSFYAFDQAFKGGARVAAGDINGDGNDDIFVGAGPGAGPHVKIFDGVSHAEIRSFYAFDQAFAGGVSLGAGDVTGDGVADVVVGANAIEGSGSAGPHVKVFDVASGSREVHSFYAFDQAFKGGVSVAAADVSGDGKADVIVGAGPGAGPHLKIFDGETLAELGSFYTFAPGFAGGLYVGAASMLKP